MDEIRNLREIALRQEALMKEMLQVMHYSVRMQELRNRHSKKPNTAAKEWLDKQEVLSLLNIADSTLYRLRKEGILAQHRLRGKLFYSAREINQYLQTTLKLKSRFKL